MCDRLRCEKNGQPIIDSCRDCLIPADGPLPEMFKPSSRDYPERCANCKWYQMARQRCCKDDTQTSKNLYCEDWEEINGE